MANINEQLQELLDSGDIDQKRAQAVQRLIDSSKGDYSKMLKNKHFLQAENNEGRTIDDSTFYTGRLDAPDLPSQRDINEMDDSGDNGIQDFVDKFGFEALDRKNRDPKTQLRVPSYVPTPRPREPHLDYNNAMGPSLINPPLAGLRPGAQQDEFDQMLKDEPDTSDTQKQLEEGIFGMSPSELGALRDYEAEARGEHLARRQVELPPADEKKLSEIPNNDDDPLNNNLKVIRPGMKHQSDEEMLNDISNNIGGSPYSGDYEKDLKMLMDHPSDGMIEQFIKRHGPDKLPDELKDPGQDDDIDDEAHGRR